MVRLGPAWSARPVAADKPGSKTSITALPSRRSLFNVFEYRLLSRHVPSCSPATASKVSWGFRRGGCVGKSGRQVARSFRFGRRFLRAAAWPPMSGRAALLAVVRAALSVRPFSPFPRRIVPIFPAATLAVPFSGYFADFPIPPKAAFFPAYIYKLFGSSIVPLSLGPGVL